MSGAGPNATAAPTEIGECRGIERAFDATVVARLHTHRSPSPRSPPARARVLIRERTVECGVHRVSINERATNIQRISRSSAAGSLAGSSAAGSLARVERGPMPSARPGNTADTAWAVLPPARAPGTDPRSPTRQAVRRLPFSCATWSRATRLRVTCLRHGHVDAMAQAREVADQRLEGEARELAAAQLGDARAIGADEHRDVVGVPSGEEPRELGAELQGIGSTRAATRKGRQGLHAARHRLRARRTGTNPVGAWRGRGVRARAGGNTARQYRQYCQVAGDTVPRQARATPLSRPGSGRDTVPRQARATPLSRPGSGRDTVPRQARVTTLSRPGSGRDTVPRQARATTPSASG